MGTVPAGLQERLEAALGPAWVIERELGDGAMSRAVLCSDARLRRRNVLVPEQVPGDSTIDNWADLYALGAIVAGRVRPQPPSCGAATVPGHVENPLNPGARWRHAIQEGVLARSSFPPSTGGRFK